MKFIKLTVADTYDVNPSDIKITQEVSIGLFSDYKDRDRYEHCLGEYTGLNGLLLPEVFKETQEYYVRFKTELDKLDKFSDHQCSITCAIDNEENAGDGPPDMDTEWLSSNVPFCAYTQLYLVNEEYIDEVQFVIVGLVKAYLEGDRDPDDEKNLSFTIEIN